MMALAGRRFTPAYKHHPADSQFSIKVNFTGLTGASSAYRLFCTGRRVNIFAS